MIYLDHAATTPLAPGVFEEMRPYLGEEYGNPGSLHAKGQLAAAAVEEARARVAGFLGARPEQILFTSSGSEANNIALRATRAHLSRAGKPERLVGATEHVSVIRAAAPALIAPAGERGRVSADTVEAFFRAYRGVGICSFMSVNNETGSVCPVGDLAAVCHAHGALLHVDAVQNAPLSPINLSSGEFAEVDLLSISSHKLGGPKGVGALFVRDKSILEPFIFGGSSQEFGYRAGTENVPGIVGFGKACELAPAHFERACGGDPPKARFFALAERGCREIGVPLRANGGDPRAGRILSLTLPGIDAEALVIAADTQGLLFSAGSACESHEQTPSHVLLAIGLTPEEARCTVRLSFPPEMDAGEIERAAAIFLDCVRFLNERA